MTSGMQLFEQLVRQYPRFAYLWNFQNGTCEIHLVDNALAKASTSEALILRILMSIWRHRATDEWQIDFAALANLDPASRQPIVDWLTKPFFP